MSARVRVDARCGVAQSRSPSHARRGCPVSVSAADAVSTTEPVPPRTANSGGLATVALCGDADGRSRRGRRCRRDRDRHRARSPASDRVAQCRRAVRRAGERRRCGTTARVADESRPVSRHRVRARAGRGPPPAETRLQRVAEPQLDARHFHAAGRRRVVHDDAFRADRPRGGRFPASTSRDSRCHGN